MTVEDEKYIVFKRDEFVKWYSDVKAWDAGIPEPVSLADSVVIRRQDYFAAPALNAYAACIAIAAKLTSTEEERKGLLKISDYFIQQAELAAEEGWKLPD